MRTSLATMIAAVLAVSAGAVSVRDHGASGDGKALDTQSIQAAIDAVSSAGGGTVVFPAGTYLSGTLHLKGNVTLELAAGAILLGSTDAGHYPEMEADYDSSPVGGKALIQAANAENISIIGRGTIDGQGAAFTEPRPKGLLFVGCRNVLVEGIALRNSGSWMQHYLACDNVVLRGLTVYNHANRNNDGMNIDACHDVRISDCCVDADDDALVLKSTVYRACENISVSNCVFSSHCNAIKMGTETAGGFKRISIGNCVVRQSLDEEAINGKDRGLAGIALEIVDGGKMDNIAISNIAIDGVTSPIFVRLGDRARTYRGETVRPAVGTLRNVSIANVVATNASPVGCSITGLPGHPVENVTLSNIRIVSEGGVTEDQIPETVPEHPEKYPECTMFGTLPAYGFFCRHVDGLTMSDVILEVMTPDARPALVYDDVENLTIRED